MVMKDVSRTIIDLHPFGLFRRGPSGEVEQDPSALLPGADLGKFGWTILDKSAKDGFTYQHVAFSTAGISDGNRKDFAGRAFVLERDSGTTRLFFVWLPTTLVNRIRNGTLLEPLNFHVLFHPPTYESWYKGTRPYWTGKLPADGVPYYVKLGIRYLCADVNPLGGFKSVANHVMAVTGREPNLAYVVPVADHAGNFADMLTPGAMLGTLNDVYRSLLTLLHAPDKPRFDTIGHVMLSGYSHSGTRLVDLMARFNVKHPFFTQHLVQLNMFDINLGDSDQQRIPQLARLWERAQQWANANRKARAYVYTSYRSHYNYCLTNPISKGKRWSETVNVNLEDVSWSDASAKMKPPKPGNKRGIASETYASEGRFGLICLPQEFFRFYIDNKGKIVGNQARGWHDSVYDLKRNHGHSLFLRGMMSHALAHADPTFFTVRQK